MRFSSLLAVPLVVLLSAPARAELRSLEIVKREPFAGGMAFGDVGPYEKIVGIARFAVDPQHARNKAIVDLDLAPRNGDGKVEFEADVCILMPKDLAKGNRGLFYDVNNRGNKLALRFFNNAPGGNDPTTADDAGDGFLMRRGYTIVWCGWIGELLPGGNRMLLKPPVATNQGKPITGVVRYEIMADQAAETLRPRMRKRRARLPGGCARVMSGSSSRAASGVWNGWASRKRNKASREHCPRSSCASPAVSAPATSTNWSARPKDRSSRGSVMPPSAT
jgi:hypothetical protein